MVAIPPLPFPLLFLFTLSTPSKLKRKPLLLLFHLAKPLPQEKKPPFLCEHSSLSPFFSLPTQAKPIHSNLFQTKKKRLNLHFLNELKTTKLEALFLFLLPEIIQFSFCFCPLSRPKKTLSLSCMAFYSQNL